LMAVKMLMDIVAGCTVMDMGRRRRGEIIVHFNGKSTLDKNDERWDAASDAVTSPSSSNPSSPVNQPRLHCVQ
jgi:hypothetical protein